MENPSEIRHDKFSMSETVVCEEVYNQLQKFVAWLASSNHDDTNIMMEYDELVGELMLEIVKGVQHYHHLDREKLIAVVKRMLDNRISVLRYRYYVTYRKAHVTDISIDNTDHDSEERSSEFIEEVESGESVEGLAESKEVVAKVRNRLSEPSRRVFDAIIMGRNERIAAFVRLRNAKLVANGNGNHIRLTKRDIADIVIMPVKEVRKSYDEIRRVYREVIHGC